jgi:hypothetical protein
MLILKFELILFKSLIEVKLNKDVLRLHPKNLTSTSLVLEDFLQTNLTLSWRNAIVNYGFVFPIYQ